MSKLKFLKQTKNKLDYKNAMIKFVKRRRQVSRKLSKENNLDTGLFVVVFLHSRYFDLI